MNKKDEPLYRRTARLKRRKCHKGHSRHNAFVEIDHRTGGIRLRCRTCHRERLKKYHSEGKLYRYV